MNNIIINMVKDEDKKHSVKFKPATDADKKFCSAFYIGRPASNGMNKIRVSVESMPE